MRDLPAWVEQLHRGAQMARQAGRRASSLRGGQWTEFFKPKEGWDGLHNTVRLSHVRSMRLDTMGSDFK